MYYRSWAVIVECYIHARLHKKIVSSLYIIAYFLYIMSSNDANIEFSGNNKKNDTDNFQTANMIYKMKTVKDKRNKKPRKRKVKNNFKNIEEFETIGPATDVKEGFYNDEKPKLYYPEEEYDGLPSKRETKEINNLGGVVVGLVEDTFDVVDKWLDGFAKIVVDSTRDKEKTDDNEEYQEDIQKTTKILRYYLGWIFAAITSAYVIFNWYYVTYYIPTGATEKKIYPILEKYDEFMRENDSIGVSFFNWFFEISIRIVGKFDSFITNGVPNISKSWTNGSMRMLLLYIVCLLFIFNFFIIFKELLLATTTFTYTDINTGFTGEGNIFTRLVKNIEAFPLVFVLSIAIWIWSAYLLVQSEIGGYNEAWDKPTFNNARFAFFTESIKNSNMYAIAGSGVLNIILFILRFVWVLFFNIPLGIGLAGVYFIAYSLFATFIYEAKTPSNLFAFWRNTDILKHIYKAEGSYSKTSACQHDETSWWTHIMRALYTISNTLFFFSTSVTMLIIMIVSMIDMGIRLPNGVPGTWGGSNAMKDNIIGLITPLAMASILLVLYKINQFMKTSSFVEASQ